MKISKFFVEEIDFSTRLVNLRAHVQQIENLLDAMERVQNIDVCALYAPSSEDFYSLNTTEGALADSLFSADIAQEYRDLLLRLQIVISRAQPFPSGHAGTSIGLACLQAEGIGALVAVSKPDECTWWSDDNMHLVSKDGDVETAIRKHFLAAKIEEKHFSNFCPFMFGNIYFHTQPEKIKDMGLSYEDNIEKIISHLSYLNDFAISDFSDGETDHIIKGRAGSHGVEISGESVKTRHNVGAMKERNITLNGEELCCEWHTKLAETKGRIHFYAYGNRADRIKAVVGDKLIIGVFADHLTT
ncbi:MAG: hypothetical protein LBJ65_16815 [Burkholderia sp.]|jgi:hypothetical protein|uniref:hypothetical protein n=1 Tax=Burkholderia sp. TaxID=36773 RepID=UPI0028292C06|nr:hypothetical protein [Burkholderia sp.]MDR0243258.1 hypothetical protein [Burkholderia sp.]